MSRLLPDAPVTTIDAYLAAGGGRGLLAALDREPAAAVAEVERSGLRGRGGAGFPTGRKWASVLETAAGGPVHLVANGAEGEPGTYKDRALLRANPFAVVEGVLVAAYATGAQQVAVGVKAAYEVEVERLRSALAAAGDAGWWGADRVAVVEGPDEYLFGEESALLEVVEGKLPLPRILPPYMYGLHATMQQPNPTVVNNVETLANLPRILADGAEAFREEGTVEAPGTMLFTVVGDVHSPGVYELPLGTPLRTLLEDVAGAPDAKAVYSGTSNTVITPAVFDLPLDFDSFREAGTGLGSGGFVVYGAERCIVQVTAVLSRFLAVESCGQCPPCKEHGMAMWETLERLCAEGGGPSDLADLRRRCRLVTEANRCYLPVGHALLVASTLDAFAKEFAERLVGGCDHGDDLDVPKIVSLDPDSGAVEFDGAYRRKRSDWSYGPPR